MIGRYWETLAGAGTYNLRLPAAVYPTLMNETEMRDWRNSL